MITTQNVLDAFDALGGPVEQAKALQAELVSRNIGDVSEVVDAINNALASGELIQSTQGSIHKP